MGAPVYPQPFPVLETDRVVLRPLGTGDLEDFYAYSSDPEVTEFLSYTHRSPDEARAYLEAKERGYAEGRCGVWGLELKASGCLVGAGGFTDWAPDHRRAEVAYTLARPVWGTGLAREVVGRLVEFGFASLDLHRIEARIFAGNGRSARFLEKLGFREEGLLRDQVFLKGRFQDIRLFSLLRSDVPGA